MAILRKLTTFRSQIQEMGVARVSRVALDRGLVGALSKIYSFPPAWHNPTSERPYRLAVAEAVNALEPQIVCEVGCGLGSILRRVKAAQRIGYDLDRGVVRAARLIRSRRIEFCLGTLADVRVPQIDVLILVNWIHELSPAQLADGLLPLIERTKYLVLDAIDPGSPGYAFHHDFDFLNGRATVVRRLRAHGEGRTFLVYRVAQ
jgi:hypothetical protein